MANRDHQLLPLGKNPKMVTAKKAQQEINNAQPNPLVLQPKRIAREIRSRKIAHNLPIKILAKKIPLSSAKGDFFISQY